MACAIEPALALLALVSLSSAALSSRWFLLSLSVNPACAVFPLAASRAKVRTKLGLITVPAHFFKQQKIKTNWEAGGAERSDPAHVRSPGVAAVVPAAATCCFSLFWFFLFNCTKAGIFPLQKRSKVFQQAQPRTIAAKSFCKYYTMQLFFPFALVLEAELRQLFEIGFFFFF